MSEQFADQEVADFIASFNALNPPPAAEVGAARLRAETLGRVARPPGREMDSVVDLTVPPLDVVARLYRPTSGDEPCYVPARRRLGHRRPRDARPRLPAPRRGVEPRGARRRLPPSARAPHSPAAVDDAVEVLRWVASGPPELGALTGRVAVAGDSAGGMTATLACLRVRDEIGPGMPELQVLIYANGPRHVGRDRWTTRATGSPWGATTSGGSPPSGCPTAEGG
jgi:acetyl esterase